MFLDVVKMLTIPIAENALILNLGLALHYLHRYPQKNSLESFISPCIWLGSHLVSEHGARVRFSLGTNVNKPPFPEFGNSLDLALRFKMGTGIKCEHNVTLLSTAFKVLQHGIPLMKISNYLHCLCLKRK